MAGILSYFLPKDKVFYSLFEQASDNLEAIAKKLVQVVQEPDFGKRAAYISEMQDIEHQNDNITHQIFIELGKNFITPFDREDIHSLASALVTAVKAAVMELRNLKNTQKIIECVIKINSIENNADNIFDMSIEKLFNSDVDAKELIKRRELYQVMETATDKCEDAGNVIESIVVKYA